MFFAFKYQLTIQFDGWIFQTPAELPPAERIVDMHPMNSTPNISVTSLAKYITIPHMSIKVYFIFI